MKDLKLYITEKYRLSKKIKSAGNDGQIIISFLENATINSTVKKFPDEFISCIKNWIYENDFIRFKIYDRNLSYLGELKFSKNSESTVTHSRKEMNAKFSEFFKEPFDRYCKYENKQHLQRKELYIKDNAVYFNCFYVENADPWIETLIIGEK